MVWLTVIVLIGGLILLAFLANQSGECVYSRYGHFLSQEGHQGREADDLLSDEKRFLG